MFALLQLHKYRRPKFGFLDFYGHDWFQEPPRFEKFLSYHNYGVIKWQWIQLFPSRYLTSPACSAANIITRLYNTWHVKGNLAVFGAWALKVPSKFKIRPETCHFLVPAHVLSVYFCSYADLEQTSQIKYMIRAVEKTSLHYMCWHNRRFSQLSKCGMWVKMSRHLWICGFSLNYQLMWLLPFVGHFLLKLFYY